MTDIRIIHYEWEVERKSKGAGGQHLQVNICGKMDWRMMQDGEFYTTNPMKATCPKCIAKIEERKQSGQSIHYKSYMENS